MNPFDPLGLFHLEGVATLRNVTLALPTEQVRRLLPAGLELGPQEMTPEGTHPVILGFHDMYRLHSSVPMPVPSLTYREHSVGIPFSYVTSGEVGRDSPGPYFFMPRLLLESLLATLGGLTFWGYPKRFATVRSDEDGYSVDWGGQQVVSLSWAKGGAHEPVDAYPLFELQRQAISQPLLGLLPLGFGPFFAASDFPKKWDVATLRPLETATHLHTHYVPGLPSGRFPAKGRSPGIDASVIGSYELRAPFEISMPYPPGRY